MLDVLIVAYKRLENLKAILGSPALQGRSIFIFVDKAPGPSDLNDEVIRYVLEWQAKSKGHCLIADENYGVGNAVPIAIDWAFCQASSLVILEDDCIPNKHFIEFCEFGMKNISASKDILLVSGTSPFHKGSVSTTSSYPLIWGWATDSAKWEILKTYIYSNPSPVSIIISVLRNPSKIKSIGFFLAAKIRVNRGLLNAWDSPLALGMLTHKKRSVVPGFSMVTNIGADGVAHHSEEGLQSNSQTIIQGYDDDFDRNLILDEKSCKSTDIEIEQKFYKMKKRQILSPIKALLNL